MKKHYIGSINSEERAATIYDRHAILTHGLRAKTNFSYSKQQIIDILEKEEEYLLDADKNEDEINEVITTNLEEIKSVERKNNPSSVSQNCF